MRRWLLIVLLLVLPLQFAWAAGAPYCAHETAPAAAKHFGHHEHLHQGGGDAALADDDGGNEGLGTYHADCEACHLGASATLPSPTVHIAAMPSGAVLAAAQLPYRSHVPSGPERPDRAQAIPAARFVGEALTAPIPA